MRNKGIKLSTVGMLKNTKTDKSIELSDDLMKKLHEVLLECLIDFSKICDKYGFYYSLSGGSALGAVRHHGFIPWDDDVDVFMTRKDYNRFIKVFDRELGEKYILHSAETNPELGLPGTQMMKRGTRYVINGTLGNEECGVYIDIFVLENAPDNKFLRFLHGMGSLYYGFCLSCARFYQKRKYYLYMYENADQNLINSIKLKIRIGKLLSWRSLDKWTIRNVKWNALCKNDKSEYVVCPSGLKHYFKEIFPRKIYCTTRDIEFEGVQLKIIKNADWALKRLYGDYMQIPPKEKRETHFVLECEL